MATSKRTNKAKATTQAPRRDFTRPWSEFFGICLLVVGVLMLGGLLSYQGGHGTLMGPVGQLLAAATYACFGMAAYLITLGVLSLGVKALLGRALDITASEAIGFCVATLSGCVLLHVMFPDYRVRGYTAGGLAGELVGEVALGLFHLAGTYLVSLALMFLGLLASTPLRVEHLARGIRTASEGARTIGVYLWSGVVDLIRTQREPVAPEPDDADLDDAYEEDEDEWVYEEEEDEEDEDASYEDAEDDGADLSGIDESALDEPAAAASASAATKRGAKRNKKNVSVAGEEAASKTRSRKREPLVTPVSAGESEGFDEPEIVVSNDDDDPKPSVTADGQDATSEDGAGNAKMMSVSEAKAAGKKSTTPTPIKKTEGMPGLIRLTSGPYELPPLHLFEATQQVHTEFDRQFVLDQAQRLVTALGEFRIRGKVTKIHPGPVITRYEFKPEAGVKLSKIESLENDIAMALEAISIRLLAPIPGKATVGFEVPNKNRETVYIKEILAEEGFGKGKKLPLALGKDITGLINYTDLAKAPHLLVAGATGSGKSVGVNAMICSLLYTCTPEEVRMVMIDPKMLELSIYEGIPHLLLPVVTDPEKAALALKWAVQEMERRYALLSDVQVRDIAGYNRKLPELVAQWEGDLRAAELVAAEARADVAELGEDAVSGRELAGVMMNAEGEMVPTFGGAAMPEKPTKLPYIVVIIDEFADLMMVSSKEVEQSVARIAAKARAAGIHLIVATQRPSVDVITGTIKNNFPSRIAFQVTSDVDSRTILDGKGAKQLLGLGDMLYMDRGQQAKRVHGCFVSEDEILKVVEFVKRQAKPVYNMDIVRKQEDGEAGDSDESLDPLYDRAVEIVAEAQKVSTSMLQRRLGIGYNRAAKIVESMEERGVIGPARGTAPREVYISAA